jgi:hypothetical protein
VDHSERSTSCNFRDWWKRLRLRLAGDYVNGSACSGIPPAKRPTLRRSCGAEARTPLDGNPTYQAESVEKCQIISARRWRAVASLSSFLSIEEWDRVARQSLACFASESNLQRYPLY